MRVKSIDDEDDLVDILEAMPKQFSSVNKKYFLYANDQESEEHFRTIHRIAFIPLILYLVQWLYRRSKPYKAYVQIVKEEDITLLDMYLLVGMFRTILCEFIGDY